MQTQIKEYLDWKATYTFRAPANYKIWLDKFDFVVEKELTDLNVSDMICLIE